MFKRRSFNDVDLALRVFEIKVNAVEGTVELLAERAREKKIEFASFDGSPIDVERMHEAMGDEPDEFAEILNLYLESTSKNLAQLEGALTSGDREQIEALAHTCAGTSANCGMNALVGPLRELEYAARQGNLSHAPFAFARAKQEFARIETFLNLNFKQPAF